MDEFDFINNIKKKYSLGLIGDDCAVLPKDGENDLLVTADMLVEGIDFRLDWTSPRMLGQKALAVSLSDIAAMGGVPAWGLLSIGVPESLWESAFLDEFYEGWNELAESFEVELAGGDVSRVPDRFVIDSVVGGAAPKGRAILRSGASPGEAIYVSGPLGSSAAGLRLLQNGERYSPQNQNSHSGSLLKHLRPLPRIRLGIQLQENALATSMIDLSDGLSSDLAHICRSSQVGARVFAEDMPFDAETLEAMGSIEAMLELALHGGEDFELLFTAKEEKILDAELGNVFKIGEITGKAGIIELVRNGTAEILPARGYRHF